MHLRLSDDAKADLHEIGDYLEPRSPQGLARILSAIFTTMGQLESFPFLGHPGRVDGTREIFVPRTPFFIVYTIADEIYIDVEAVIHSRRKFPLGR